MRREGTVIGIQIGPEMGIKLEITRNEDKNGNYSTGEGENGSTNCISTHLHNVQLFVLFIRPKLFGI